MGSMRSLHPQLALLLELVLFPNLAAVHRARHDRRRVLAVEHTLRMGEAQQDAMDVNVGCGARTQRTHGRGLCRGGGCRVSFQCVLLRAQPLLLSSSDVATQHSLGIRVVGAYTTSWMTSHTYVQKPDGIAVW